MEEVVRDRRVELKIKLKSLAAEARIIRQEEIRCRRRIRHLVTVPTAPQPRPWHAALRYRLYEHRTAVLRPEARYSQLAYAFLRGRPYRSTESRVRPGNEPSPDRVANIAHRFASMGREIDGLGTLAKVEQWLASEPAAAPSRSST